jgi:hypothetical protein
LNVMAMGLGWNAMVALLAICLALGTVTWVFQDQADATLQQLGDAFRHHAGLGGSDAASLILP